MEEEKTVQEEPQEDPITSEPPSITEGLKAMEEYQETRKKSALEILASKGVTQEKIDGWKQMFGRIKTLPIQGKWFIFRGLSRLEWEKLADEESRQEAVTVIDGLKKESRTVSKCILHPAQLDPSSPAEAGVTSVLFGEILKFSGFEADLPEGIEL